MEFTSVELAGSAEIIAPVEKAMAGHSDGERGPGEMIGHRSWHEPLPEKDGSD